MSAALARAAAAEAAGTQVSAALTRAAAAEAAGTKMSAALARAAGWKVVSATAVFKSTWLPLS